MDFLLDFQNVIWPGGGVGHFFYHFFFLKKPNTPKYAPPPIMTPLYFAPLTFFRFWKFMPRIFRIYKEKRGQKKTTHLITIWKSVKQNMSKGENKTWVREKKVTKEIYFKIELWLRYTLDH